MEIANNLIELIKFLLSPGTILSVFSALFLCRWFLTPKGMESLKGLVQRKGFIALLIAILATLSYQAIEAPTDAQFLTYLSFLVGDAAQFTLGNFGEHWTKRDKSE